MLTRLSILSLLPVFLLLPLSQACNPRCKFARCKNGSAFKPRLINQKSPFLLRAHEKRWLPFICRRLTTYPIRIKSIETGEARVRPINSREEAVRISDYKPRGLNEPFGKSHFHVQKFRKGEWVVVREKTKGNQEKYLEDLCVTIPVKGYRYMNRFGRPRGIWRDGKKSGDCLSFRTRTVKMLVELRWSSRDDMDISVEEPDGRIASRFRHHESCGKLNADVGSILGVCANIPDKSESIGYFGCLPKGRFIIRVAHYRNCGKGAEYEVRVTRFGKLVYSKVGKSKERSGTTIEEIVLDM